MQEGAMKTLVLSLAALSLALFAWQFDPLERLLGKPAMQATKPVNFDALHAQARGALQRLHEKHDRSLAPADGNGAKLAYVAPLTSD
jgi:hypothetical protein